jgi:hypothetical protein
MPTSMPLETVRIWSGVVTANSSVACRVVGLPFVPVIGVEPLVIADVIAEFGCGRLRGSGLLHQERPKNLERAAQRFEYVADASILRIWQPRGG